MSKLPKRLNFRTTVVSSNQLKVSDPIYAKLKMNCNFPTLLDELTK